MFDFFNVLYVVLRATYDPIIIKSGKTIYIFIKRVRVEFLEVIQFLSQL